MLLILCSLGLPSKRSNPLEGRGLNLQINNTGVCVTRGFYDVIDTEMLYSFRTNCIGPLLVTRAFLPLLKLAAKSPMSCSKAAIVGRQLLTMIFMVIFFSKAGLQPI